MIPSFAHISEALHKVSRADEILWMEALESKFEDLKQQLHQPRLVQLFEPSATSFSRPMAVASQ